MKMTAIFNGLKIHNSEYYEKENSDILLTDMYEYMSYMSYGTFCNMCDIEINEEE